MHPSGGPAFRAVLVAVGLSFAALVAREARAVEEGAEAGAEEATAGPDLAEEGRVSASFGLDVPTAYWWRGFLIEDQGLIVQPWLTLEIDLLEGRGSVEGLSAALGTWGTFLTGPAGEEGSVEALHGWYEQGGWAGVYLGFTGSWSVGVEWQAFASPSEAYDLATELDLVFERDDDDAFESGLWRGFHPQATLAVEVQGQGDGGEEKGLYLELGVRPRLALAPRRPRSALLVFPATLGLGFDGYYEDPAGGDETFGYLDVGAEVEVALPFLPSSWGTWTVAAGLHGILAGDAAAAASEAPSDDLYAVFRLSVEP